MQRKPRREPAPETDPEPVRDDWLKLTPSQRLLAAWRMRRQVKDLERDHDEKSLPRL